MAKVLVAGGLFDEDEFREAHERFACALARCLIERGHVVLGDCRTALNTVVTEAAERAAKDRKFNPRAVVRSWVTATTTPSHRCGELMRSQVSDELGYARPLGKIVIQTARETTLFLFDVFDVPTILLGLSGYSEAEIEVGN